MLNREVLNNLLYNNEIDYVLHTLQEIAVRQPVNTIINTNINLVSGRYLDLTNNNIRGILSFEELIREKAKIREAISNIINQIIMEIERERILELFESKQSKSNTQITIKIEKNLQDFSSEDQLHLFTAIKSLLHINGDVVIAKLASGSVLMSIVLPKEKALKLLDYIKAGGLKQFLVVDAYVDTEAESGFESEIESYDEDGISDEKHYKGLGFYSAINEGSSIGTIIDDQRDLMNSYEKKIITYREIARERVEERISSLTSELERINAIQMQNEKIWSEVNILYKEIKEVTPKLEANKFNSEFILARLWLKLRNQLKETWQILLKKLERAESQQGFNFTRQEKKVFHNMVFKIKLKLAIYEHNEHFLQINNNRLNADIIRQFKFLREQHENITLRLYRIKAMHLRNINFINQGYDLGIWFNRYMTQGRLTGTAADFDQALKQWDMEVRKQ